MRTHGLDYFASGHGRLSGCFEHRTEPSGSIKFG